MRDIEILDCTLRDGGFINNWHFGYNNIVMLFQRLNNAGIDIVEVGYLIDTHIFNHDYTLFPDSKSVDDLFKNFLSKKAMISALIDYGKCDLTNIEKRDNSFIDTLRITFKKDEMKEALAYCKNIKAKGFGICIQPVSITTYSDRDMLDLIDRTNEIDPYAVSIVDTYGLMHKEKLMKYFYLMDNNLNTQIKIGYHSHNNFQLAYSNSTELLNSKTERSIIIDSSLYGMGKGAGNTNTELIAMYLNDNFNKHYDISELLEAIDIEILKIREKYTWGYSFSYFVSAFNDCHPDYIKFLKNKNTLSIKSINTIVNKIEQQKKLSFDKEYIEQLYFEYQINDIDDTGSFDSLKNNLSGKDIILIGPGSSIISQRESIIEHISMRRSISISVNHIPLMYDLDYIFISNSKRYGQFIDIFLKKENPFKIIATSNIIPINNEFNYVLNYENLLCQNQYTRDISLLMLLNFLEKIGITTINLAGFDGFSAQDKENYYDGYLDFQGNDQDRLMVINKTIKEQIHIFRKKININFITESIYE